MLRLVPSRTSDNKTQECPIKYRVVIAAMVCSAAFMSSMLKVDLPFTSVALLEPLMTERLIKCGFNTTWQERINYHSLNLTRRKAALFISSYFIGNVFTVFSGDIISGAIGPVWTVGAFTMFATLMMGVIPFIITLNIYAAFFNRFIVGVCVGPIIPSCYKLIINWAPPQEIRRFLAMIRGFWFGPIFTWPLIGLLVTYKGWEWGFHITSIIGFLWSFVWILSVSNYPEDSFFITQQELKFIRQSQMAIGEKRAVRPPYGDILRSGAVWAYIFFEVGGGWFESMYIVFIPMYLNDVTEVTVLQNGIYSAMPLLARFLVGNAFTYIYKKLIRMGYEPIRVQKMFTIVSHYIPSAMLATMLFTQCRSTSITVLLLIILVACNGLSYPTSVNYLLTITPNLYFTIYTYGYILPLSIASMGFPFLYAEMLESFGTETGWSIITTAVSASYFIAGSVFLINASDKPQIWDNLEIAETRNIRVF